MTHTSSHGTAGTHLIEAAAVLEQDSGGNDVAVTWIRIGTQKLMF